MKPLPEEMARAVGTQLRRAEAAHARATSLIAAPGGHSPEQLEDALNELMDAAYLARGELRPSELSS